MLKNESLQRTQAGASVRVLKIEADGDAWKGSIKPRIRLTGRWLERAGFNAGRQVEITCVAPGLIELRSRDGSTESEISAITPNRAAGSV